MRAIEFLFENYDCKPGWQEEVRYPVPGNFGKIIFRERLNNECITDEFSFIYFNDKINTDHEDHWVVSFGLRQGRIIWHDYFKKIDGEDIGPFKNVNSVKELFLQSVAYYTTMYNSLKAFESKTMKSIITTKDIEIMMPEMVKKMMKILNNTKITDDIIKEESNLFDINVDKILNIYKTK